MAETYRAKLDGTKCRTIEAFLSEVSRAFAFPEYFGGNYNALWDSLTDLQWLGASNYELVIEQASSLLSDETPAERDHLLDFLNRVTMNWKGVPNYPGEEEFRNKATFQVVLK
jgi:RNAse (barnase) inhibitor barstar